MTNIPKFSNYNQLYLDGLKQDIYSDKKQTTHKLIHHIK